MEIPSFCRTSTVSEFLTVLVSTPRLCTPSDAVPTILIYNVIPTNRAMITTPLSPELGSSETEMENYEALLHVAERLSEEKPRGLNKVAINQIPSFK